MVGLHLHGRKRSLPQCPVPLASCTPSPAYLRCSFSPLPSQLMDSGISNACDSTVSYLSCGFLLQLTLIGRLHLHGRKRTLQSCPLPHCPVPPASCSPSPAHLRCSFSSLPSQVMKSGISKACDSTVSYLSCGFLLQLTLIGRLHLHGTKRLTQSLPPPQCLKATSIL